MPRYTPEQALENAIEKADAALAAAAAKRDALYVQRVALVEKIDAVVADLRAAIDRKDRAQKALAMMRGADATPHDQEVATEIPTLADVLADDDSPLPTKTRRASADETPKDGSSD